MSTYEKKYNPNRSSEWNYGGPKWKLSRSKIDFFLECPRCFYIDNVLGTKRPSMPSFNLNIAVDELLKKEFDAHRREGTAHPIMNAYNIEAVPFAHPELEAWRDAFTGIITTDGKTNLVVSGAVDDIWVTPDDTLIVIDYKSTSKVGDITSLGDSPWEAQYGRQLSVYRWLLEAHGFSVAPTAYLLYANARKDVDSFSDTLVFRSTLVSVPTDTAWIPKTLEAIKACLDAKTIPESGSQCEYCPYREAAGKKLLKIHNAQKTRP